MKKSLSQKNSFQLRPVTPRESYFVKNIIQNEPIIIANSSGLTSKETMVKSSSKKCKNINGLNEDLSSSCGILTKRSYGSVGFNHQDRVQLNNYCSIQDNMISSDVILANQDKRQNHLKEEEEKRQIAERRLKRQAVSFREYNDHMRIQEITDAYYFANQETMKAKQRQKERQNVINRVKSLSRSKSKEVGLEFRKKELEQMQSIQQVEQLKEKYSHVIVPELMGTQSSFRNTINTLKAHQKFKSPIKTSRLSSPQELQVSRNIPIQTIKSIKKRNEFQSGSIQNSRMGQVSSRPTSARSTSDLHSNINLNSKTLFDTKNTLKQSVSANFNPPSLMKVLQKSKSTEDFLQKQRVKVIKEAFIINWRQGNDKKHEKHDNIYPCKHTEKVKGEKDQIRSQKIREKNIQMYGENVLKKNPLEENSKVCIDNRFKVGYDTLKEYQMKFNQIANNKIKSCITSKY